LKQYTNVTINSGKTYTAKAWNGTVGGILGFLANGTVSIVGNISANGKGFRGGAGTWSNLGGNVTSSTNGTGYTGEGPTGLGSHTADNPGNLRAPTNPGGVKEGIDKFRFNQWWRWWSRNSWYTTWL
jgi:hypothetical protein